MPNPMYIWLDISDSNEIKDGQPNREKLNSLEWKVRPLLRVDKDGAASTAQLAMIAADKHELQKRAFESLGGKINPSLGDGLNLWEFPGTKFTATGIALSAAQDKDFVLRSEVLATITPPITATNL